MGDGTLTLVRRRSFRALTQKKENDADSYFRNMKMMCANL